MADGLINNTEVSAVCDLFDIETLYAHQRDVLNHILCGRDVFPSTKTSSGKSLCYQALPIVLRKRSGLEPIILVISPLVSIMTEQVTMLQALGFSATFIGSSESDNRDIMDGKFTFVYSNPETILATDKC